MEEVPRGMGEHTQDTQPRSGQEVTEDFYREIMSKPRFWRWSRVEQWKGAEHGRVREEDLGVENECIPPSDIRMSQHFFGKLIASQSDLTLL